MTGPENYRMAQDYLQAAAEAMANDRDADAGLLAELAQGHAMLAQAAAIATEPARMSVARRAWREWADAVQPGIEWTCDICGETFRTAPGGEPPDLEICRTCKTETGDVVSGWI